MGAFQEAENQGMKSPRYMASNDLKWKEMAGEIEGLYLKRHFNKDQKTVT